MAKGAKKAKKSKSKKKAFSFFKILGYVIVGFFLLSLFLTILYKWVNPPITPLMVIRKVSDGATIKKDWVDLEDISPYMVTASMAAEDNNFLGHNGFDFGAIQKAIDTNKKGKKKRGASTISQQTAKNVFLWTGRSWMRKGLEVYFTFLIEKMWSKDRIMEVYLNVIEMGDGIYGCEAAAETYFHTSAKKLSKKQACLIAACYPNPRRWSPANPTNYITRKANRIAYLMPKLGKVKFDEKHIEKAQKRYKKREEKRIKRNDGKIIEL